MGHHAKIMLKAAIHLHVRHTGEKKATEFFPPRGPSQTELQGHLFHPTSTSGVRIANRQEWISTRCKFRV